ncbi:M23 family metallopeptidase [Simiduia agarivorans]|uniref:Peptidase, M23/M37 family protein n=1 Tax=Simiduia agarivorans (strain DSM 21679 / JCM 13881 / BCRC 17597 / SA1) TaxID=1117647 RepID=K4KDZ4_SIMAS|nr:M23 family metallopeptidase [Simiduia agarivorans]AFU97244.1 peptidase, M23/M37 family protein [Simiduia agarivorans SA1 = DSM 21679]
MKFWQAASFALVGSMIASLVPAQTTEKAEYRQGSVVLGKVSEGTRVFLGDRELKVSPDGRYVFGIGRDEKNNQRLRLLAPDGSNRLQDVRVLAREYRIQRVNGVPSETVTPPEAQLKRIREEAAQAWAARDVNSDLTDFAHGFIWPLIGPVTGVYGSQRIYNGVPKNPHFGVDVAAPTGTVVVAPAGGIVRLAHEDMFFSGGTLILDHGHGLTSSFIHLSALLVEKGERVEQGQPIAEVGATGRATGPHLDWRMNWFDVRVDPATLVGPMPKQ